MSDSSLTSYISKEYRIEGQSLVLHPLKAFYWKEKSLLCLSDLHFGKVSHFRKKGMAVPANTSRQNFENLKWLISEFSPKRIVFTGDLFHSGHNAEWEEFCAFITSYSDIHCILVQGNHDVLTSEHYSQGNIWLINDSYIESPFKFTHYPPETKENEFVICGHLHPGVRLVGSGKQKLSLPCFYISHRVMIMPAFGQFTGKYILTAKKDDTVFVIAGKEVIQVA